MLREPVDPSCPSESSDNPHPRFTRSLMLIEYAHELIERAHAASQASTALAARSEDVTAQSEQVRARSATLVASYRES